MQPNELIDRYVNAVGEHLPRKTRADIQTELKSLLAEMLEARAAEQDRPADALMTAAVLREFGEPGTVAERYAPPRPLIGPSFMPPFILIRNILIPIIVIVSIVGTSIALVSARDNPETWGAILWAGVGGLFNGVVTTLGSLVIIFAILERLQPWSRGKATEPWDPLKLPEIENPNRLDRADVFGTVFVNLAILALLNGSSGWFSAVPGSEFVLQFQQIFGEGLYRYLPWISLSCIAEIALYLFVLYQGRWTRGTRVAEILSDLFGILILVRLLTDGAMLAADVIYDPFLKIGLMVTLAIVLVSVGLDVYRLVTQRWNNPNGSSGLDLVPNGQP